MEHVINGTDLRKPFIRVLEVMFELFDSISAVWKFVGIIDQSELILWFSSLSVSALSQVGASAWILDIFKDSKRLSFVLITTVLLETCFWACVVYYMILIDKLNIFGLRKYRIKNKAPYPSNKEVWKACEDAILNHWFVRPAVLLFVYPMLKSSLDFSDNLPTVWTIVWQFALCMQIDDCLFYWFHRLAHHKLLYKYIHKRHHEFK